MALARNNPFNKLTSSFSLFSTVKTLPIRRPTALSPISNYGQTFQVDQSGDIVDATLHLNDKVFEFEDGYWNEVSLDGTAQPSGSERRERNSERVEKLNEE